MGGEAPETCWTTHKRPVINLWNCCIWLVDLFELPGNILTSLMFILGFSLKFITWMYLNGSRRRLHENLLLCACCELSVPLHDFVYAFLFVIIYSLLLFCSRSFSYRHCGNMLAHARYTSICVLHCGLHLLHSRSLSCGIHLLGSEGQTWLWFLSPPTLQLIIYVLFSL